MERELSLRDFWDETGIDPSNMSKYERGVSVPTEDMVLKKLARGLRIAPRASNPEWNMMLTLASAARGIMPAELLQAQNQRLMRALPAFFQKLKDDGLPDGQDEVDALVDVLKKVM